MSGTSLAPLGRARLTGRTPRCTDIAVDDLDAAVGWAVDAGAALAETQPQEDVRVLLDPDGHPFCLFKAPGVFND